MTDEIVECYRLLELQPGASPDAVRDAYRDLLKVWHPDRFPDDPKFKERANEKTKTLNEAYKNITAYLSGSYTESRASARARAAAEEVRRARETTEAKQREETARRAWEAAEARTEQARLREEQRRREEQAERDRQQARTRASYSGPTPTPISPNIHTGSKPQQPLKKKADWGQYLAPAVFLAFIIFVQPKCNRENQFKKTKSAAEAGDPSAQRSLAQDYANGQIVQRNDAEAARWYLKAAEQEDATAQVQLGWMYDTGQGVPQNYEEAFKWYSKAANQGNAYAQNNLGVMYQNGQAVQRDDVEAYRWYCLSADQGNTNAINNRNVLLTLLTPQQFAEGQRRVANPRANPGSVAAVEFERDFYERYPDLKPYVSLVDAVARRLEASGYKGESREAVMETFAKAAREEIKRQQAQPTSAR
jgi:TPR repeat protein